MTDTKGTKTHSMAANISPTITPSDVSATAQKSASSSSGAEVDGDDAGKLSSFGSVTVSTKEEKRSMKWFGGNLRIALIGPLLSGKAPLADHVLQYHLTPFLPLINHFYFIL
jgi:hypothetical protein